MDPHPRYTLVGIVLVIALSCLVLWFSWLWNSGAKKQTDFYQINFRNQSLAGVQIDGIVTFRGMRVGTIKSINIDNDDIESVWVKIAVNKGLPVKQDTRALIARNLLTGLASIDLVGSSDSSELLRASDNNIPVIKEGQAGFDQIFQQTPELISKSTITVDKFAALLTEENIKSVSNTLKNLEHSSGKLIPVLDNLNKSIESFNSVTNEAKGQISPLLQQANRTALEVQNSVQSMAEDFQHLTRSAANTANSLKEPRSSILGLPSGQLGPGEKD